MTPTKLEQLAREAVMETHDNWLSRFADLVLEEAAKVCEALESDVFRPLGDDKPITKHDCAEAVRALKEE